MRTAAEAAVPGWHKMMKTPITWMRESVISFFFHFQKKKKIDVEWNAEKNGVINTVTTNNKERKWTSKITAAVCVLCVYIQYTPKVLKPRLAYPWIVGRFSFHAPLIFVGTAIYTNLYFCRGERKTQTPRSEKFVDKQVVGLISLSAFSKKKNFFSQFFPTFLLFASTNEFDVSKNIIARRWQQRGVRNPFLEMWWHNVWICNV
jgi:hypothetical protein